MYKLPPAFIQQSRDEQLADGTIKYVVPWALEADDAAQLYLRKEWDSFHDYPGGTAQVGIQRDGRQYVVYIPHNLVYKWHGQSIVAGDLIDHIIFTGGDN